MAAPAAPAARSQQTRARLIEAAAAIFAARGYRGATMREIAESAGANLAAAHYHFGSKQDLYREVTQEHFERLESRLHERGATLDDAAAAPSRAALTEMLRARLRTLLEMLLDPAGVHATLMLREMTDPSEVLPFLVRRWIDPWRRETEQILAALAPKLGPDAVERCTRSVVGQVFFYRTHRPALLLMMKRRTYPAGFVDETADHILAFTLAGIAGITSDQSRRAPRARRPRRSR